MQIIAIQMTYLHDKHLLHLFPSVICIDPSFGIDEIVRRNNGWGHRHTLVASTLAIQNEVQRKQIHTLTRKRWRRQEATSLETVCHQTPGDYRSRYRYTASSVPLRLPRAHSRPNWMWLSLDCVLLFPIVIIFSSVSITINQFWEQNNLLPLQFSYCPVAQFQVENTPVVGIIWSWNSGLDSQLNPRANDDFVPRTNLGDKSVSDKWSPWFFVLTVIRAKRWSTDTPCGRPWARIFLVWCKEPSPLIFSFWW